MLNTPSVTCTTCSRAPLGLCWWTVISGEGRSEPVTWQSRWYLACFLSNVFFYYTSFILNLISLVMMLLQNFCIMMTPVTRLASFKQMCMWQTDPSSPQDKRNRRRTFLCETNWTTTIFTVPIQAGRVFFYCSFIYMRSYTNLETLQAACCLTSNS